MERGRATHSARAQRLHNTGTTGQASRTPLIPSFVGSLIFSRTMLHASYTESVIVKLIVLLVPSFLPAAVVMRNANDIL